MDASIQAATKGLQSEADALINASGTIVPKVADPEDSKRIKKALDAAANSKAIATPVDENKPRG